MNSGVHVQCHQVSQSFPKTGAVLDSIDLNVNPGDFVTFLGPSGCGKSTLLKLIASIIQPSTGKINLSPQSSIGFVFQDPRLLPWLTVLENVELPLKLQKRTSNHSLANTALDLVHYSESRTAYPRELSGGMKMRVAIARAWVTQPKLLLLDEPFSALDEHSRNILQVELRNLWLKTETTILFVTHSLSEALFLSERIIGFSKRPAKVIAEFTPQFPKVRNAEIRYQSQFSSELLRLSEALPWLKENP